MNRHEAGILRKCIIEQYESSERISDEFTNILKERFNVKSIDDWALSVSEIIDLNLDKPELYFMAQMAKIARLMGVPKQEADLLAIELFADIDIPDMEGK